MRTNEAQRRSQHMLFARSEPKPETVERGSLQKLHGQAWRPCTTNLPGDDEILKHCEACQGTHRVVRRGRVIATVDYDDETGRCRRTPVKEKPCKRT